jgi:hypothetical protein
MSKHVNKYLRVAFVAILLINIWSLIALLVFDYSSSTIIGGQAAIVLLAQVVSYFMYRANRERTRRMNG